MSNLAAVKSSGETNNKIIAHKLCNCKCPRLSKMFKEFPNHTVQGYETPFPTTPSLDPDYVPRADLIQPLLSYIIGRQSGFHDEAMNLCGLPGAGKTSVIRYLAAIFNWPVYSATGHANLELPDVIGRMDLNSKQGASETSFLFGALPLWAEQPHAVFIFNEFSFCSPEVTVGLNSVLDGGPVELPDENIYIQPKPSNLFFMTGNSSGLGDLSGFTPASQLIDGSTNDRFLTLLVPYATEEEELAILKSKLTTNAGQLLPDEILTLGIKFASLVRASVNSDSDSLPSVFTIRTMIRFWKCYLTTKTTIGQSTRFEMAIDMAYCNKFTAFESKNQNPARTAVLEFAQSVGFSDALDSLERS